MKKEKGITLIALVITIIVLIILAMISISMLTGENGLLRKAFEARIASEKAEIQERAETEVLASIGDNGKINWDKLKENLAKNFDKELKSSIEEKNEGGNFKGLTFTVQKNKRNYKVDIDEEGNVTVTYKGEGSNEEETPTEEPTPEEKPPQVQSYSLAEGYPQITTATMQKYVGTDGTVNPILTSYDSILKDIIGQCIVGQNSWKDRLMDSTVGYTADANHNMLYSIEFTTDAKEFLFTAVGSLRVSVDEKDEKGYQYTKEEGEIDVEGDNSYMNAAGYNQDKFRFIKVSFENSKERNIKIELMGAFANLYADSQYSVKKIEKEKPKTMMFVGDSWTTGQSDLLGTTAVLPYRSYPTIIANNFGMTAINLGVGGTGYTRMTGGNGTNYQERIQYSIDNCGIEPDYIFICGGGNDVTDAKFNPGKKSLEEIANTANECYKYAKTKCQNVIVLGLEYVEGASRYEASEDLKKLNVTLKEKAKENQIPYIDFVNGEAFDGSGKKVHENDNFVSDPNYVIDTVHLSYEGYKSMANKLTPVIRKLINK